jgi:hypothetical protein
MQDFRLVRTSCQYEFFFCSNQVHASPVCSPREGYFLVEKSAETRFLL